MCTRYVDVSLIAVRNSLYKGCDRDAGGQAGRGAGSGSGEVSPGDSR